MTTTELADRLAEYMVSTILPQVSGWKAQAAIGAASSATGKSMMIKKLAPWMEMVSENGHIDIPALKCAAMSAVKTAGKIPVLFDLITIDSGDMESLFKFLEEHSTAAATPSK